MIVLDTCVLIFDALTPKRLTALAKQTIIAAERENQLFCSDISFWEIAMLIYKKRLSPGVETKLFLQLILDARGIQVLPINIEIAALTATYQYKHYDPADRLIAATVLHHQAKLITADKKLAAISELQVIW